MSVRTAVVGCGLQGRLHVEALSANPDAEVVAVCDADPERARSLADEHGVPAWHGDWRELVESCDCDLLSVCTMPNTHRDISVAALERGAHVLCEKPMALDQGEAAEMVAAATRAERKLFVGYNARHIEAAQAIRRFTVDGRLGEPLVARSWMRSEEPPWWGRHYVRELSGGGALAASAVHMLDLLTWLAGSPTPVAVSAWSATLFPRKRRGGAPPGALDEYDVDDFFFGSVRFDTGFHLAFESSWIWDSAAGYEIGFELVGDRGQSGFDPLWLSEESDGKPVDVTAAYPIDQLAIEQAFPSSVEVEVTEVVAAVRGEVEATVTATGEEGLLVQAIVDALYASAREGRELPVAIRP